MPSIEDIIKDYTKIVPVESIRGNQGEKPTYSKGKYYFMPKNLSDSEQRDLYAKIIDLKARHPAHPNLKGQQPVVVGHKIEGDTRTGEYGQSIIRFQIKIDIKEVPHYLCLIYTAAGVPPDEIIDSVLQQMQGCLYGLGTAKTKLIGQELMVPLGPSNYIKDPDPQGPSGK